MQWILILYQWRLDSGFRIPIIGGFPDSLELRPSRLSWIPLHGVILNAVNKMDQACVLEVVMWPVRFDIFGSKP